MTATCKVTISRGVFVTAFLAFLAVPGVASAQSDKWEVAVAPLYLWASEMDGRLIAADKTVPLFLPFDAAADKLGGAFSFHGEARKGRWGGLADVNFIRLSTDAEFTTPVLGHTLEGTAQLDMTVFEAGVSYLVNPDANFSVIGGVRSYTLSPNIELAGPVLGVREVDVSKTAVSAFGGFMYRPELTSKLGLVTRADIGGGGAFMWSGTIGLEYRFKPWGGLSAGYHALGVDTGDANSITTLPTETGENDDRVKYDVTHYGPFVALTLHWTQK